jgi:alpha-glucosidase
VYIRSFADSNADGVGDLDGVRSRLGYLELLGVDALWITPCYRSPMADHGYDVADPRDIDPLSVTSPPSTRWSPPATSTVSG